MGSRDRTLRARNSEETSVARKVLAGANADYAGCRADDGERHDAKLRQAGTNTHRLMRRLFVWVHRYVGLGMAAFLIFEGLTGSLLAFYDDLERLISPQFYATPKPGTAPLDFATLAERAAALVPQGEVAGVDFYQPRHASVVFNPRKDPATGKPHNLVFNELFLDPWTGKELGRRKCCDISEGVVNLMPLIYSLHASLKIGPTGMWILGIVALLWTLDCFFAFYLTLPVALDRLWLRWQPSWLIKRRASFFSFNFLLHRASGLWLWPILFIFAWSSVMFNLRPVYEWVTSAAFQYSTPMHYSMPSGTHPEDQPPKLGWRAAEATGQHLIAEEASRHRFTVLSPLGISYEPSSGAYMYTVKSSLDVDNTRGGVTVMFDGDTGALQSLELPVGQHSGNTVSAWLSTLHLGNVFGLSYRIFVCVLGFAIAMLSVTGVYIWWKKRWVRVIASAKVRAVAASSSIASVS